MLLSGKIDTAVVGILQIETRETLDLLQISTRKMIWHKWLDLIHVWLTPGRISRLLDLQYKSFAKLIFQVLNTSDTFELAIYHDLYWIIIKNKVL